MMCDRIEPWTAETFPSPWWDVVLVDNESNAQHKVIAFDPARGMVAVGGMWTPFEYLCKNFKQLNGEPCGTQRRIE